MSVEQEQFRNWLLGQPPSEILNQAAKYAVRDGGHRDGDVGAENVFSSAK